MGAAGAGLQMGQGLVQNQRQTQQYDRSQGFQTALTEILQSGIDYRTPQGQTQLIQGLNQKGFGPEAMELAQKFPKQAAKEYDFREGSDGLYATNKSNPTESSKVPGFTPKPTAAEYRAPKFETGKDGFVHRWDDKTQAWVKTGLQGQPQQPNPYTSVLVGNPDGSTKTVFVDPRNPSAPPVDPGLPRTGGPEGGSDIPGLEPIPGARVTKQSIERTKKATETYLDLITQIENYKKVYDAVGTEAVGANAEDMNSRAIGIQLSMKELENLGVLNGDDLRLMRELVPEAGGLVAKGRGMLDPVLGDKFYTKMGTLTQRIEGKYGASLRSNGFQKAAGGQAPAAAKPHAQDSEAVQWAKANPNDPRSAAILKANGQ